MFNAGSNLKNKTAEEICFQDFKKFNIGDVEFGVGQINSMNKDELHDIKKKLIPYLKEAMYSQGLDRIFFMLTNIIEESTELLCDGAGAREQVFDAFDLREDTEDIILKGVVSRKKQLIPNFVIALQQ
jgi:Inorganic pyrophosphatase/exopolyphosphatase